MLSHSHAAAGQGLHDYARSPVQFVGRQTDDIRERVRGGLRVAVHLSGGDFRSGRSVESVRVSGRCGVGFFAHWCLGCIRNIDSEHIQKESGKGQLLRAVRFARFTVDNGRTTDHRVRCGCTGSVGQGERHLFCVGVNCVRWTCSVFGEIRRLW